MSEPLLTLFDILIKSHLKEIFNLPNGVCQVPVAFTKHSTICRLQKELLDVGEHMGLFWSSLPF